jgi:hypothetical protein
MKRSRYVWLSLSLALIAILLLAGAALANENRNFTASLKGRNEVPPVETNAQGQAIFHLSKDGTELHYKLIAANIVDVTQSHIHCGAAEVNGPVVAFLYGFNLYGFNPDGVSYTNGILAEGTITAADIIGPRPDSEACPGGVANLDEMLAKMRSGDAYVNVHTVEWQGGEIRGPDQVELFIHAAPLGCAPAPANGCSPARSGREASPYSTIQ